MSRMFSKESIIIRQEPLSSDIFSVWLSCRDISAEARAGQFVGIYSRDSARLLPRPVSLCEIDHADGAIRLVYRVAGAGTAELSRLHTGDIVRLIGPLGNGYPVDEEKYHDPVLIGGGAGIPPLLELSKSLKNSNRTIVIGYRRELFLYDEFEASGGRICIAMENGYAGVRGNVMDAINTASVTGDVVYACGPKPMLSTVAAFAREKGIPAFVSLEEHMACGVGACLGCVVRTKHKDPHSNVNNARICTEGPVFDASEVLL